jgi:hypothetical protein
MKLSEIFDHLSYGELSQLHIGGELDQGITPDNRHRMITHIMLGLTTLHRRFLLREGEAQLYLAPGLESYTIDAPDLLKVEQVYDTEGNELTLDDRSNPDTLSRSSRNVVRVPTHVQEALFKKGIRRLNVKYRADHVTIGVREAAKEPEKVEVDLPSTHLEALLYFIASRMMNPIGVTGSQGQYHEGDNYAQKFEQACRQLEAGGFQLQDFDDGAKFRGRGFV